MGQPFLGTFELWEYPPHRSRNTPNCGRRKIKLKKMWRLWLSQDLHQRTTVGLLRPCRSKAETLVCLIRGDTEVNYQRHKTRRAANLDCWFCGVEEETATYILCECESLSNTKRRILKTNFIEEPCFRSEDTRELWYS